MESVYLTILKVPICGLLIQKWRILYYGNWGRLFIIDLSVWIFLSETSWCYQYGGYWCIRWHNWWYTPPPMVKVLDNFNVWFFYFFLQLITYKPWRIRGKPKVMVLGRSVLYLPHEIPGYAWSILHQIWLLPNSVDSMSRVLEWVLIHG